VLTWTLLADVAAFPKSPADINPLYLAGGAGVVLLLLLLVLFLLFRGRGKRKSDTGAGLAEDLSTYPPAPGESGRVSVLNHPARLRLVVVAPVGKKPLAEPEAVLEQVLRGLGKAVKEDRPRVRTWPPQLSSTGFAPTFFRLTRRPEPEGKPSRWVLVAGKARAGGQPVLIGLALWTDEPTDLGRVTLEEMEWPKTLGVER
jgi:hypothetical protein